MNKYEVRCFEHYINLYGTTWVWLKSGDLDPLDIAIISHESQLWFSICPLGPSQWTLSLSVGTLVPVLCFMWKCHGRTKFSVWYVVTCGPNRRSSKTQTCVTHTDTTWGARMSSSHGSHRTQGASRILKDFLFFVFILTFLVLTVECKRPTSESLSSISLRYLWPRAFFLMYFYFTR